MVRLKDIAIKTGYSVNTISLALRDSPRLSKETRTHIQDIAKSLNYRPNHVAKSLVNRQSNIIGLILTDIRNPVLTSVAHAVEIALADQKYGVLYGTSNNNVNLEKRVIEMFRARQVDGILAYPNSRHDVEHLYSLRDEGFPIVSLVNDPLNKLDVVSVNEKLGAIKAVTHLANMGHKIIGMIGNMNNKDKYLGYRQVLKARGLICYEELNIEPKGDTLLRGYWSMDNMMNQQHKPTAIFADNDSLALGVLRWAEKNNVNIPNEMSLIGFDNIEYAEYASVPISTMNYDVGLVTDLAIERLIELINAGDELPPPRMTQIEPELIIRTSSGPLLT